MFTNGLWYLLGFFLPAWLLIGGSLPFWPAQASLAGANGAVVGVLLAALYNPSCTEGISGRRDVAGAIIAFGLLQHWKTPHGLSSSASLPWDTGFYEWPSALRCY